MSSSKTEGSISVSWLPGRREHAARDVDEPVELLARCGDGALDVLRVTRVADHGGVRAGVDAGGGGAEVVERFGADVDTDDQGARGGQHPADGRADAAAAGARDDHGATRHVQQRGRRRHGRNVSKWNRRAPSQGRLRGCAT